MKEMEEKPILQREKIIIENFNFSKINKNN